MNTKRRFEIFSVSRGSYEYSNLEAPQAAISTKNWIISKREDLTWFIGSTLAGYLAIALIAGLQHKGVENVATFIWSVLIAGPHFFATFTRTYFDSQQRTRLSKLLWMIVPLSFLPVAVVALGGKTYWLCSAQAGEPFT